MHSFFRCTGAPVRAVCAIAVLSFASVVAAQTPPDAGSIRQEIDNRKTDQKPPTPPPAPTAQPDQSTTQSGPTVRVSSFQFSGNTLITSDNLSKALGQYTNRTLNFSELQAAADAVAEVYRQSGWIVRAYLPMQEIANGTVNITVVEAIFGATHLEGTHPKRIDFEHVKKYVDAHQAHGAPLSAQQLDRALLLVNDLPGIGATANLRAGARERETDLLVSLKDEDLITGDIVVDNFGSKFTGEERAIASVALNSPFKRGDQATGTLLHAQGTDFVGLGASTPIGLNGWRAGAHASYLQYKLIDKTFEALDAQGSSSAYGLDASYPLIRGRRTNVRLAFAFDDSRFNNRALNQTTSRYKVDAINADINAHHLDSMAGGGLTRANLTVTYGKVDLSGSPNEAADAATTQVNGGFSKVRYSISREQQLRQTVSLFASLSGQIATHNLDSSEKFYLGGSSGVRAYQPSEAGGDQGTLLNVETRLRLPYRLNATLFYDWGQIKVNRDSDFPGAAAKNSYSVHGAGVAVGWLSDFGLSAKVTWAHRFNDGSETTGGGVDTTIKSDRVLFQVGMSF